METLIFEKTERGHDEIATREKHLAARARTLLLLVDGKRSAADLLRQTAGIGITLECIRELFEAGLIRKVPAPVATQQPDEPVPPAGNEAPLPPASEVLAAGQTQYEAIYAFYTETIKSALGLRGYALQLKVERAASIDDFRSLRRSYLDAVIKVKGKEMERSLRHRLDQLLYMGEAPPTTVSRAPHPVRAQLA